MYKKPSTIKPDQDTFEHGFNYALFLLGLRLRTEANIEKKMQDRGYSKEVIEKVRLELLDKDYVNDERYLENMIESFKNYKTYGFYMVKNKLIEKGFKKSLIESKLSENFSIADELEVAHKYLEKNNLSGLRNLEYKEKQNLAAKLHRRGFRGEVISKL